MSSEFLPIGAPMPYVADEAVGDDLGAAPVSVAAPLPAPTDHDRSVRVLLEREEAARDAEHRPHCRPNPLRDGELVDKHPDWQVDPEPAHHRLDPDPARKDDSAHPDGSVRRPHRKAAGRHLDVECTSVFPENDACPKKRAAEGEAGQIGVGEAIDGAMTCEQNMSRKGRAPPV